MPLYDDFFMSQTFLRIQRHRRQQRMMTVIIDDVEPRSKQSMPDKDKLRIQQMVLDAMQSLRRRAFQTPVVVDLHFETTERTPAHIQTIAKNLLDLLGKPLDGLSTGRKALLYGDDSQIHVLCVSCHHGQSTPNITIQVSPLRDLTPFIHEAA